MSFTVQREIPVPIWQQIYTHLRASIRAGVIFDDDRLPPSGALAQEFGVNRHTVRQALKRLEDDGLVEMTQGSGTFLVRPVVEYLISQRTRYSDIISGQGMVPETRLLDVNILKPSDSVATVLGIRPYDTALLVRRLLLANGRAIGASQHFFDVERFSGMERAFCHNASVTSVLKAHGIDHYYRRATSITVAMPDPSEADLLKQSSPCPVIKTRSINTDERGNTIEFGFCSFDSQRVRVVMMAYQ